MTSATGKSTSLNVSTTEQMGTEQCELSEKTHQIGSECLDSEQRVLGTVLTSSAIDEKSTQVSANNTENSVIQLPAPPQHCSEESCQVVEGSCLQQSTFEQVPVHLSNDKSENKCQTLSQNVQNAPVEISDAGIGFVAVDQMQSVPSQVTTSSVNELLDPASGDAVKNISSDGSERKSKSTTPLRLRHKGDGITDQFSKIRAHLRYLLNRVSYEQSLIDAYSGEGWKGYSMEKLKPEKEIQRAKSEILRRKLKIRDLFRNLDSLCAEGRLPESLFDSEGEIDSEDIFCAKCQSKELSINNDIILCDGACDRGFHQLCLDPPLLTEDKDVEVEGGESSSDESEYASASEKLEDSHHEDQYLGLPSDDSEDDDFDPNAPDLDNKVKEESSSSDFTSDSEDLAAAIKDNTGQDEDIISASVDDVKNFKGSSKQKREVGKKPSMADELSSLLKADPGQEASTPVSGKRNVERLDYKKLYDEAYQSDDTTSDDEDWTDTATPRRKKNLAGKMTSGSPNGNASDNATHTPRRNIHQNKVEDTFNSPTKSLKGCLESGSRDKKPGSSTYKRLGEAVVQRLHQSFKENQYPDRTTKESLAQELGLTFQQVDKWFGNTRWSFRNSSHMATGPGRNASQQVTDSQAENKGEKECELVTQEVNGEKSKTPSSIKRKRLSEPQGSEAQVDVDGTAMPPCSPRADESQIGNKMKTRKRK
ncbi:Zinc finger, FYVE/PHD-type [Sesbania bispinosa]|nr:Zinc finger, FYVE/PHD-type [Sesbania bispinosa]